MTTDYNQGQVAEQYKKAKEQPWRSRIETYSFMKRIGDLKGKKVVDVACGEGHFTRMLRQAGAARVVGVDISERMIELARAQEDTRTARHRVSGRGRPGDRAASRTSTWRSPPGCSCTPTTATELARMCQGAGEPAPARRPVRHGHHQPRPVFLPAPARLPQIRLRDEAGRPRLRRRPDPLDDPPG